MGAVARPSSHEAAQVAEFLKVSDDFRMTLTNGDVDMGVGVGVEDRLRIAQPVSVNWNDIIFYDGFTVDMGIEKILLAKFPRADGWLDDDFTPAVLALIELAEVILDCDRLYVCIDRNATEINCLVRSLLYVGFSVAESPFSSQSAEKYLMLSYETE
ncbi:hypothetical protein PSACC_03505 [Paramicrosporidium saccamoebae]|uniref:Uncharacterized protein n=1 Tax=Paramicrosporidium saccamoebae TaxID=1246581 RepID=A0A2H9TGD9_9FUNG|nr:hypothetical protein PSACC_03505 [Paramicrosporidium saccamoebae]